MVFGINLTQGRLMKIIVISTLLIISATLTIGCFEDNKDASDLNKLVGTWKWTGENEENTYNFYENHSLYSYYIHLETEETHEGWGTFDFNQSKLCMSTTHGHGGQSESYCYDYVFSEDNSQLTLSSVNLQIVTLNKIE